MERILDKLSILAEEKLTSLGLTCEMLDNSGLRSLSECGWAEFSTLENDYIGIALTGKFKLTVYRNVVHTSE